MSYYRRARIPGGTYFFTVVTYERIGYFEHPDNVTRLRDAFRFVLGSHPFRIDAAVILPDHMHMVWTLPKGDADYGTRWRLIKSRFSPLSPATTETSFSRRRRSERPIWQRRFWEHAIKSEDDLHRHMDYIHFNPVKHHLVERPSLWPFSSLQRAISAGVYPQNWGENGEPASIQTMEIE